MSIMKTRLALSPALNSFSTMIKKNVVNHIKEDIEVKPTFLITLAFYDKNLGTIFPQRNYQRRSSYLLRNFIDIIYTYKNQLKMWLSHLYLFLLRINRIANLWATKYKEMCNKIQRTWLRCLLSNDRYDVCENRVIYLRKASSIKLV